MTSPHEFWRRKHQQYVTKAFVAKPNLFALEIADHLKPSISMLDLGCGQGQDAVYFARRGLTVTACDFSQFALAQFKDAARSLRIEQQVLDLSVLPYPFPDSSFEVVYAHLSLHYFDVETSRRIFREVARILRDDGRFYACFNSILDPESRQGTQLEPQFRELSPGNCKRFFSVDELPGLLGERFTEVDASYGRGTTKNRDDQYVRLTATRTEGD